MPKAKPPGSNQYEDRDQTDPEAPTLYSLGITKSEATQLRALGELEEEEIADYIEDTNEKGKEVTVAGAVEAALRHPKAEGMTDQGIADHCGVTQQMVNEYRNRVTYNNGKSTENGYRKGKDGVKRKTPAKKPAAPKPEPAPEPEDDEPLTDYEEQIAAQYQASVTHSITEPERVAPEVLEQEVDRLVSQYCYEDFRRLAELMAERIAVDA